jgi:hypothetical protein
VVLLLVTQTKLSTGVGTDYRGSDGCNNILLTDFMKDGEGIEEI